MLAFVFAPFYIAIHIYIVLWIFRFIDAAAPDARTKGLKIVCLLLFLFLCLTPLFAFLASISPMKKIAARISNYWMGIFIYAVMVIALLDVVRLVLRKRLPEKKYFVQTGSMAIILIAGISVYGIINAKNIRVTDYAVSISSEAMKGENLRVALVADLHMGYSIGWRHMERVVQRINEQKPDLVCIAGDIFDNYYEAMDDPDKIKELLRTIEAPYGVYACYGNHDYEEAILAGFTFSSEEKVQIGEKMREFLQEANIETLEDEVILIDDSFYLAGRRDYSSKRKSGVGRKSAKELLTGLDASKPIFVMDHQPRELDELAQAGADLDLCGHTHDGQLFPGNILTELMWENSCGYVKKGEMHNIVTSGAGIFGPYMRVGTKSEIAVIDVNFS